MHTQSNDESQSTTKNNSATTTSSTRRRLLKAVSAAGIAGLAGCSSGTGNSGDTFTLGVNVPLSGGNSLIGEAMVNSAKIARTEINDNGGLAGQEIELIEADNGGDPQTGVQRTQTLINQDGVDAILGPVSSAVRNSMSPICKSNQTPLLYPTSYEGPAAPDYCNEYLFKTSWVPTQQVDPVVPWLIEEYGDSFYLLGSDYLWPQEMNAAIAEAVNDNGGEVVAEEYVQIGATDFSSIIVDIDQKDPDILMTEVVGGSPAALQKQLANNNMRDSLEAEVGLAHSEPSIQGLNADQVEGVILITGVHTNMENETNQQFTEKYYDEYGDDAVLGSIGAWCYTSMNLLNKSLADADDASAETILESLPGTTMDSIGGPIEMKHDHQVEVANVAAQANANNKFDTIQEFNAAMPPKQCDDI